MPRFNWRRFAKWIALGAFLLLAGVIIAIHLDPVQQFALRRVEEMARVAGHPFSAKHLRFKPFELEAFLTDFVYDDRSVRFEASDLEVDFPWKPFSANSIVLNRVSADHVRVTIQRREPPSESAIIPRISIGQLNIKNAMLSYVDPVTRVDVPDFDLAASGGPGTIRFRQPITISPNTTVQLDTIPVNLSSDRVSFGPLSWSGHYEQYGGSGSARGIVRWAPTIAAAISFQTSPLDIEQWKNVAAHGLVRYEDSVLYLDEFRATRGMGVLTASAILADADKSATLRWNAISLEPLGAHGETDGDLELRSNTFDLKNIAGQGHVRLASSEYGTADSDVSISGGRAHLRVHAKSYGADIRADVNTGLDRRLAGKFEATHRQYGVVSAQGQIAGTIDDPRMDADIRATDVTYKSFGLLNGSAKASYRDRMIDITDLMASFRHSSIPDGAVHVDLKSRTLDGAVPQIVVYSEDFVPDAVGLVEASAKISGTVDNPMAALTASSAGMDIGGTHIDSVQADATLTGSVIQVARIVATQQEGRLEASGTVNLETEQTQGQAKVSNLQITNVRDFSGVANLEADISGSYRDPSATMRGEVRDVVYDMQQHGSVVFNGVIDQHKLDLELDSTKYKATVESTVSITPPYPFTATVRARESRIAYKEYSAVADGRVEARGALEPAALDSIAFERFTLVGEGVNLRADGSLEAGMTVKASADLSRLPSKTSILPVMRRSMRSFAVPLTI
jgi:hypothetical protein